MTQYYKNGNISLEQQFVSGEKNGNMQYFRDLPDVIEVQFSHQANKRHGPFIQYMVLTNDDKKKNDEVVIALQCEYKSGKLDGTKIEYQRTLENRIFIKSQYVNGKMNGDEFYDSFGDKAWEVLFGEGTNALRSITSREVYILTEQDNLRVRKWWKSFFIPIHKTQHQVRITLPDPPML